MVFTPAPTGTFLNGILGHEHIRGPELGDLARRARGRGFGATVERTAEFAEAFKAARQSGKPSIIHVKIDPEAITPATTLAKIREQATAKAS